MEPPRVYPINVNVCCFDLTPIGACTTSHFIQYSHSAEGNPAPVPTHAPPAPGSRSPGKIASFRHAAAQRATMEEPGAEPEEEGEEDTFANAKPSSSFLGGLPLPLPPALQRLGGLVLFLSAALVLGGVSGFLLARVVLPPPPSMEPVAVAMRAASASANPSSSQAAAIAAAVQQEEARLREQQQVLKQQEVRLAEQQRRQQRLQRELEAEAAAAAAAAAAFERRQEDSQNRAMMVRPKDCPCDGIPLLKIIVGRIARTVGRLLRFLDKQGKNRGAMRRRDPGVGVQEEEGPGVFDF